MEQCNSQSNQSNNNENSFQEKEDLFEVQEWIEKLKLDFESEYGKSIENYFSDGIEKSCEVHKFIFNEVAKESDPKKRSIINLAHLKLEAENHQNTEIISRYGDKKGKRGNPLSEVFVINFHYNQMLSGEQEIAKGSQGQKIKIDMKELSEVFQEFTEEFIKRNDYLKEKYPDVDSRKIERTAIMEVAERQTEIYFGGINQDSKKNNNSMYNENLVRYLHDFKGNQNAACTEYAMLIQQLISFAGIKSELVSGGPLEIANDDGTYELADMVGHAYNLIYFQNENDESIYLFDPSNPIITKDTTDTSKLICKRYLTPLTQEQLTKMNDKGFIEIDFEETKRLYSL